MSWLDRLSEGLKKTSSQLGEGVSGIFTKRKLDAATLEELEELLILSDMGAGTAASIVTEISENRLDKDIAEDDIKTLLAEAIAKRLEPYATPLDTGGDKPRVILVVGVNGNGKTTTIGKLAHQRKAAGDKVVLVAADTFRAAAVEQLEQWAQRANVPLVKAAPNADPAAVAYQGVEQGVRDKADLIFIDTAGRLHTKQDLMAELTKIIKVIRKLIPDAPHQVIQVLDATTGQNALAQLKAFREVAGVTGLVVTKLDGTAKAGILLALAEQFKLPIHAVGVGEGAEDLQPFEALSFARSLVGVKTGT